MKTSIYTIVAILLCVFFTSTLVAQERFEPDSRLTDIIVKVEPTALQLPVHQARLTPTQAEIKTPELSEFVSNRDVQ